MNKQAGAWWVKIPKLSMRLDFITSEVRNPLVIFVNRNWTAILNSWVERSAGDPNEIAKHCLSYYSHALSSISERKYPAFAVDYEYACRFPNTFARAISEAIQIETDEEMISRAQKMITDDGGGYVDLPEFNFSVKTIKKPKSVSPENFSNHEFGPSEIRLNSQKDIVQLASSDNLKKEMLIGLRIKTHSIKLQKYGLRFYANYGDGYFPAHAHRPALKSGENHFLISFDKIPKSIALGPIPNTTIDAQLLFIRPANKGEKFVPIEAKQSVFEFFAKTLIKKIRNH